MIGSLNLRNLQIGDIVRAKHCLTSETLEGPVVWIQPYSYRVAIKGCGCLFSQTDVEPTGEFVENIKGWYNQTTLDTTRPRLSWTRRVTRWIISLLDRLDLFLKDYHENKRRAY